MVKHWTIAFFWAVVWGILGVILASIICSRFVPSPVAPGKSVLVWTFLFLEYREYANGTPYLIIDILVSRAHPAGWTQILITLAGGFCAFGMSLYSHRPRRRVAESLPQGIERMTESSEAPAEQAEANESDPRRDESA